MSTWVPWNLGQYPFCISKDTLTKQAIKLIKELHFTVSCLKLHCCKHCFYVEIAVPHSLGQGMNSKGRKISTYNACKFLYFGTPLIFKVKKGRIPNKSANKDHVLITTYQQNYPDTDFTVHFQQFSFKSWESDLGTDCSPAFLL